MAELEAPHDTTPPPSPPSAALHSEAMRVLIVDDEESVRKLLVRALEDVGYLTCWASSGEGALELLRTESIQIVVLDLDLGKGMSGQDVAFRMLLDPRTMHIPIAVITGSGVALTVEPPQQHPLQRVFCIVEKTSGFLETLLRILDHLAKQIQNGQTSH